MCIRDRRDTDRALEGIGPARAALVQQRGRFGPVHRLGNARHLAERFTPQPADRGDDGARWPDAFKRSIGVALKDEEDLTFISGRLDALLAEAAA